GLGLEEFPLYAAKNGHTILLGEDDLEVCSYLETALKCQGYAVELAQDGDEVLSALQSTTPFSAVILEVVLPGKNSIEALKVIRRHDAATPIIMIAATASALNVVEAMKNGASDFLVKPINPEDLRRSLRTVLGNRPPAPPKLVEQPVTSPEKEVFFGANSEM